jgi:hypothetical protein
VVEGRDDGVAALKHLAARLGEARLVAVEQRQQRGLRQCEQQDEKKKKKAAANKRGKVIAIQAVIKALAERACRVTAFSGGG